ncbi:MAG: ATP-binding cassette domain-containing protein, partial [Nevskiaceae bacterium]
MAVVSAAGAPHGRDGRGHGPLLRLDNVTLKFAGLTALNDVSLSIPKASVFAVIGPNGAGKTSLFNCISGVYQPQSGEVR